MYGLGSISPRKKPTFWRLHYLSWPNRITYYRRKEQSKSLAAIGTLLYSYNRQQLITKCQPANVCRWTVRRQRWTVEITWDGSTSLAGGQHGRTVSSSLYCSVSAVSPCNPSSWTFICIKLPYIWISLSFVGGQALISISLYKYANGLSVCGAILPIAVECLL